MPDLQTIRADALALIIDVENITSAQVDAWVVKAQREAEDLYGFLPMETELEMTTSFSGLSHTIGDKTSPTTVRWARRRASPYYVTGTGKVTEMSWAPDDDDLRKIYNPDDPTETGAPVHLSEKETDFRVYPLADGNNPSGTVYSDGEYRIRAPYVQRFSTLTADGHTNWLTEEGGGQYLVWFAAGEGMLFNRDREEFLAARSRATAEIQRLIRLDKRSRFSSGSFTFGAYPGPGQERI